MTKSASTQNSAPRLCPTCGTRVGAAATKCLVCGADLSVNQTRGLGASAAPNPQTAATLRRTGALALLALVILIVIAGITLIVAAFNQVGPFTPLTPTITSTATQPPTFTPLPTATETPVPTATPLPPLPYTIVTGDTCIKIAVTGQVSVQSLQEANPGLNCNLLIVGQAIQVPQPTPTPMPLPTTTLSAIVPPTPALGTYTVHAGDTLQVIANVYKISVADLMTANGIADANSIRAGQVLVIPLPPPTGPTPTATGIPLYLAPNPLQPSDGAGFTPADSTVSLQWASVGELRAGEFYQVILEDVTCNCAAIYTWQTVETKWIVPVTVRPADPTVHTYRWRVTTVRQRPDTNPPVYDPAGAASADRVFSWLGGAGTPAP